MQKEIIFTSNAPKAIGPYSQAVKIGDLIFTSGQIPLNPNTGEIVLSDVKDATVQCLENLKAVLAEAGTTMDNVVKTTVFLKDLNDFSSVNEVYASYFTQNPPARSCIQVAKLPMDAMVEIEVIAKI